jgi:hypothetical protein
MLDFLSGLTLIFYFSFSLLKNRWFYISCSVVAGCKPSTPLSEARSEDRRSFLLCSFMGSISIEDISSYKAFFFFDYDFLTVDLRFFKSLTI